MEISFEPDDVQLEHIIRLLGNLTKSKGIVFLIPGHPRGSTVQVERLTLVQF